jgi:hypothetical protein
VVPVQEHPLKLRPARVGLPLSVAEWLPRRLNRLAQLVSSRTQAEGRLRVS